MIAGEIQPDRLLSLVIWVPIAAGALVLATGSDRNAPMARMLALAGALAGFIVALPLYTGFNEATAAMQFRENLPWVSAFHIRYTLGVDGISMPFILLNSFTTVLVVVAGWRVIEKRVAQYMAAFLIMSGLINGVFAALDAVLFYVFFEAMLIPMYLIIGMWGGPNRVYAAIKFFLYTLLGSLLMLVAFLYLYFRSAGSFSILDYYRLPLGMTAQVLLFIAFFLAFAIKVPMWPVHTWLPGVSAEAPTGGSVMLLAITGNVGAYGLIRFVLPITPDASHLFVVPVAILSFITIDYLALVALVQGDMKKLIAYSSISHMGFVTLGFFMFNTLGLEGGLVQMMSDGLISAGLILCVGMMYDRLHSRRIKDYGGLARVMPVFAAFFMLFALANSGLPATSGFVGEFMVILSAMRVDFWYAFAAALTLVLGAAYTLWMYKRVIFGKVTNPAVENLRDLDGREVTILALLAVLVLALGIYPKPFTDVMHASVSHLLAGVDRGKLL